MYAVTSTPLESRTRATLRSAELGFLGVMILTCKQTPFFWGQPCKAGCFGLRYCLVRAFRTNWLMVGMHYSGGSSARSGRRNRYGSGHRRGVGGELLVVGLRAGALVLERFLADDLVQFELRVAGILDLDAVLEPVVDSAEAELVDDRAGQQTGVAHGLDFDFAQHL